MQVQQPQQQQVVSYQYQQAQSVQNQQGLQQTQQRYVIQHQQSGAQSSQPTTPQRFFIKSPHQGTQRHLTPQTQSVNHSQQQYATPTSNHAQQPSPARQQWQPQQHSLRGQIMHQQIPLQQGMPQKRTIMIQSNSPMQGNIIRLQPNSNYPVGQPRMMQIQQQNTGTMIHSGTQSINSSSQQQYSNVRMSNGVQGTTQVIRTSGPPRAPQNVNIRQMTANAPQGQYPVQSMGNIPQQPSTLQQQATSNQRLQNTPNQWENQPKLSLQTSHQPHNPRLATPQQQSFVMQMRPSQPVVRPPQVSIFLIDNKYQTQ